MSYIIQNPNEIVFWDSGDAKAYATITCTGNEQLQIGST